MSDEKHRPEKKYYAITGGGFVEKNGETGDIIDTYVYRVGLTSMQYSFATAIGLMKSVIAFVLMMLANHLAKKYTDSKIF